MLDFYLIADSERKPITDNIDNLKYAGGIEMDIYSRLVKKGIIDSSFEYSSDFRWDYQFIRQIDLKAKGFESDTDVRKLKEIIDKAIFVEFGLIALGD